MRKPDCNKYVGGKLPPCANFLSNDNPIIKDGKVIFRNMNRLYFFIGTLSPIPTHASLLNPNHTVLDENIPTLITNIQISLPTYIIGLLIFQIESKKVNYDKSCVFHNNKSVNSYIHKTIQSPPKIDLNFLPSLTFAYSNGEAILHPLTYVFNISPLNYLILLILNRLEGNPGLFFINNSYTTYDIINILVSDLCINFSPKK